MRLTLTLLGLELDLSLGRPTADEEPDPLRDLGTTGCYPITFAGAYDVPEEVPYQQHTPAWDEPDERGR